jgi:hypothetical protein
MMKSVSAWKVIQIVILCALLLAPLGCRSYDQMGETAAEGDRRHKRVLRLNNNGMMEDLDRFMLLDRPSKLTDMRIP